MVRADPLAASAFARRFREPCTSNCIVTPPFRFWTARPVPRSSCTPPTRSAIRHSRSRTTTACTDRWPSRRPPGNSACSPSPARSSPCSTAATSPFWPRPPPGTPTCAGSSPKRISVARTGTTRGSTSHRSKRATRDSSCSRDADTVCSPPFSRRRAPPRPGNWPSAAAPYSEPGDSSSRSSATPSAATGTAAGRCATSPTPSACPSSQPVTCTTTAVIAIACMTRWRLFVTAPRWTGRMPSGSRTASSTCGPRR